MNTEKQELMPGQWADDFHLVRYREIPDVGLLLDQTVRLVNSYLEPLGNVRITGSMVSNYVKQKILPRPVKKLYYRGQIAALIFIALSKTVLSLEDTTKFLQLQKHSYPEDVAYDYFCRHLEKGLRTRFSDPEAGVETGREVPGRDRAGQDSAGPEDTNAETKTARARISFGSEIKKDPGTEPEPGASDETDAAYLLDCLVTAITDSLHLQYCIARAEL